MRLIDKVCILIISLSCTAALGQDVWTSLEVASACGSQSVKLTVTTDSKHHSIQQPNKGEAIVYVIQDVPQGVLSGTTRVGIDGQWIGANQNRSHFFVVLKPGVHHVCVSGQWSKFMSLNSIALRRLTLKDGEISYLRVRFLNPGAGGAFLGLESVDEDEGKFLVETSDSSMVHSK